MRYLIAAMVALAPGLACAQSAVTITPAPITGYGTLAVLAASLALSTATVGPNSPAFPASGLPNRYLEVRNSVGSASTLYVCPLGGTCTASVGVPLAAGEVKTWMIPATSGALVSPTVISATTATALVAW